MSVLSTALVVAAFAAFAVIGVALALIDIHTHRLPNRVVAISAATGLVLLTAAAVADDRASDLVRAALGAIVLLVGYLALRSLSPTGIGGGDVKLAGVIGLHLGWLGWGTVLVGAVSGFVLGGVFAAMMLMTRQATVRTPVAFGPWMIAGAWVAIILTVSRP